MPLALPRRSTRAATDRVDKRELILRAAVRTFADRGFFGAQVADVARAAGVAAGTVYLYFRGKDDLLVSIFERTMREAITEGKAAGVFRRTLNPTLAAKVLFGALDEMATNWVLSRRRYALAADADAIVDLFVNGIGAS